MYGRQLLTDAIQETGSGQMQSRAEARKTLMVRGGAWAADGTSHAAGQGAAIPARQAQESGWIAWLPQVASGFQE